MCDRWAKLRIAMIPHMILLEPLSECLMLGVLAAWALNFIFLLDPFAVYLFHMLLWFLLDYVLLCIVQVSIDRFNAFLHFISNYIQWLIIRWKQTIDRLPLTLTSSHVTHIRSIERFAAILQDRLRGRLVAQRVLCAHTLHPSPLGARYQMENRHIQA